MSRVYIIVAIDRKRAIGFEGKLLFHLPDDMKRFKALTTGNTVIMGRKTFESLPKGALPNRRNIVLTKNPTAKYPEAEVFSSLEKAIENCKTDEKVFIIGGASVYEKALPLVDELCITEIDDFAPNADTFFPTLSTGEWIEKSREEHLADEKNHWTFAFVNYIRKK
ncbi:MAG: dihydrofolate reductase [Bacteroidaceae bacterium]|nr:dihydrofolate reductase [Bacteroidaceae bacterium]